MGGGDGDCVLAGFRSWAVHLGLAVLIFKESHLDPSRVNRICLGILLYRGLVCLGLGPSGLGAQGVSLHPLNLK